MKKISIGLFFLIVSFLMNTSLYAKGIPILFGDKDDIHKIMDIKLTGKNGQKLFLGYKTHSYFLIAGVYIKDKGYVLGSEENSNSYYSLPTGDDLKSYQNYGLLPKKLPKYNISFISYLIGYSLWVILLFLGIYFFEKNPFRKKDIK
jgi:hypothetical protein